MKRRIGLLVDTLIGGGAERITLNLFNAFTELGHEAHIFIVANKIEHSLPEVPPERLHSLSEDGVLSGNKMLNKLLLARRLRGQIRSIEARDGKPFAFFISSAEDMDRLSRIARLPNVLIRYRNSMWVYLQNKIGRSSGLKRIWRNWRFTRKFRSIYSGRDIVTVSKALEPDLIDKVGVRPRSIRTIYNPFNFDEIRKKGDEAADFPREPYILYAARFENRKRHDLMVRAYALADVPIKLVLMGGIYTRSDEEEFAKVRHLAEELGVADHVIFPGFRPNPYPWIRNARLFAMSSDSEGLPTVLIESLILGTPVISTNCPTGPSEILIGDLARFLSPVDDANALANNIRLALKSYPPIDETLLQKYTHLEVAREYLEHAEHIWK